MNRIASLACIVSFSIVLANGAEQAELKQAFRDLQHDGVLMNISAHPDDEDGSTLAYYRKKFGVRTHSLFFTRGEGGQNEIGPELYEELGVIRTEETKRAARIQGTEVHFLNLLDFGYSKNAGETFGMWGGEQEALRRLVYYIRKLKPDVIFTNHDTSVGHGHHQAVALTALAAFDASNDPAVFPEQLQQPGLTLWQPRKLFVRLFNRTAADRVDVSNPINEIDLVTDKSYLEIAAEALQEHRSQGMDKADLQRFTRGLSLYSLARSDKEYRPDTTSFFAGMNLLEDLQSQELVKASINRLDAAMELNSLRNRIFPILNSIQELEKTVDTPLEARVLNEWAEDLRRILVLSHGMIISVIPEDAILVPGQTTSVRVNASAEERSLKIVGVHPDLPTGWSVNAITANEDDVKISLTIGKDAGFTLPRRIAQYYPIENRMDRSLMLTIAIDSFSLSVPADLEVEVAPPVEVSVTPVVAWISVGSEGLGKLFEFSVTSHFPHKMAGRILPELPEGWRGESGTFVIPEEDSTARGTITVRPPLGIISGEYHFIFNAGDGTAEALAKVFDIKVAPGIFLGVIKSYDNTIEAVAQDLGVRYELLDDEDLGSDDLSRFSTIVVDIRAYAVRNALREQNDRLLDYVRRGGHLIVMYQKDQDWVPAYAPYPFTLTRKRVCEEDSPVTILVPRHPLLNKPNAIVDRDWSGWVQERGVYFPGDVPQTYLRILSCSDKGEEPLTTGYLVTHDEKGSYIYTSYVWYRQLKERHEGALKCFANMISYPFFRE
jgi:LmbE family N-acetylglucosaminyl deacetylase